jgi:HSP20 family protein
MPDHTPDHEVELFREDGAYVVILDLPGVDRADIDVRWHDGRLHVHADKHGNSDSRSRVVNRHVSVPHKIEADRIRADYDDGLLEVTLPIVGGTDGPGTKIDVE